MESRRGCFLVDKLVFRGRLREENNGAKFEMLEF